MFSKKAPKGKGMLARAMEKDMKEQAEREAQEQQELMDMALNDPNFRAQIKQLQG